MALPPEVLDDRSDSEEFWVVGETRGGGVESRLGRNPVLPIAFLITVGLFIQNFLVGSSNDSEGIS